MARYLYRNTIRGKCARRALGNLWVIDETLIVDPEFEKVGFEKGTDGCRIAIGDDEQSRPAGRVGCCSHSRNAFDRKRITPPRIHRRIVKISESIKRFHDCGTRCDVTVRLPYGYPIEERLGK